MAIAIAGHDHAGAMHFFGIRVLQIDRHLCPGGDWVTGAKFNSTFADADRIGSERQPDLAVRIGLSQVW